MKIYLDTCSLHRPLDDKSQPRIALEAEAILAILSLCEQEQLTLVSSEVLTFEVDRNPHPQRKAFVTKYWHEQNTRLSSVQQLSIEQKHSNRMGLKH
jgi:hypothetical protein